jgi:hypothetical protein
MPNAVLYNFCSLCSYISWNQRNLDKGIFNMNLRKKQHLKYFVWNIFRINVCVGFWYYSSSISRQLVFKYMANTPVIILLVYTYREALSHNTRLLPNVLKVSHLNLFCLGLNLSTEFKLHWKLLSNLLNVLYEENEQKVTYNKFKQRLLFWIINNFMKGSYLRKIVF